MNDSVSKFNKYIELAKKYKKYIFIVVVIIILVFIYVHFFYNKIPKCINHLNSSYAHCRALRPIEKDPILMGEDYKLKDFFVASSHKSYLACPSTKYASLEAIRMCLKNGCRFLDLDIFNKDFKAHTEPVVCYGKEQGNWHYSNELCLDACCKLISKYAFSSAITNYTDPLFININLYVNNNFYTLDKIHDIFVKNFSNRFLPTQYSHQHTDVGNANIKDLINNIIFICDDNETLKDSKLDEIINLCANKNDNIRTYEFNKLYSIDCGCTIDNSEQFTEIKNHNQKSLTRIYNKKNENYNFYMPWYMGVQFICMKYNIPDNFMNDYLNHFRITSFVLKPLKLREKNTNLKRIKTPFYEINY